MQVSVTTRFVDRLLLPLHPGNPDAADTPIGAIVDADPPRCLALVRAGVAVPVGISLADLEQAAIDFAVVANAVPASTPIAPPVDEEPAEPAAHQSDVAEPATASEPSDGGPVDLAK